MEPLNSSRVDEDNFYYYVNPPFDSETFELIVVLILRIAVTGSVCLFGVVSNSVNLVVFYQQGLFSHSSMVSLAGLAISDFFFCALTLWGSVCLYFFYLGENRVYGWGSIEFYATSSSLPSFMFSDISSFVTTFISIERLVSVIYPFQVKALFTPKRSCVIIISIFVISFIYWIPNLFTMVPIWTTNDQNVSSLQYIHSGIPVKLKDIYFYSNAILRTTVLVIVVLCNVTISWKVNVSQKFRKLTASTVSAPTTKDGSGHDQNKKEKKESNSKISKTDTNYNSSKEMKLVKMILVICTIFMVSFILDFMYLCVFRLSGLKSGLDYHWTTDYTTVAVMSLLMTINASCNIIVYYTMSTRYREELLLCLCNRKK